MCLDQSVRQVITASRHKAQVELWTQPPILLMLRVHSWEEMACHSHAMLANKVFTKELSELKIASLACLATTAQVLVARHQPFHAQKVTFAHLLILLVATQTTV